MQVPHVGTPDAPLPEIRQREPVSVSVTLLSTPEVFVYRTELASVVRLERVSPEKEGEEPVLMF